MKIIYALRSFVFYCGYAPLTIIFGLLATVLWLFPRPLAQRVTVSWNGIVLWWLGVSCGVYYRIQGAEHVPKNCVVASNHQSPWETIFIQHYFFPVVSVLKKELLNIPFFGWGLRLMDPIAIDRSKPAQAVKQIKQLGKARLASGYSVMIFPEGTRMPVGAVGEFKRSAADIAKSANVPLLPLYQNSGNCWPNKQFIKIPGTIDVVIGEPIDLSERNTKEVIAEVQVWMEAQQQIFK